MFEELKAAMEPTASATRDVAEATRAVATATSIWYEKFAPWYGEFNKWLEGSTSFMARQVEMLDRQERANRRQMWLTFATTILVVVVSIVSAAGTFGSYLIDRNEHEQSAATRQSAAEDRLQRIEALLAGHSLKLESLERPVPASERAQETQPLSATLEKHGVQRKPKR